MLWSYEVLNVNLKAWFTNPVDNQVEVYKGAAKALDQEIQHRLNVQAALLAAQPETGRLLASGARTPGALERFAQQQGLESIAVFSAAGDTLETFGPFPAAPAWTASIATARIPLPNGAIELATRIPLDAGKRLMEIKNFSDDWAEIVGNRKDYRNLYTMLMLLITMFVLFVATWLARILANRISTPITAILEAADEVRKGNLQHRVTVRAEDELALLVNGFNQMTEALESSGLELDRRRRFTEAILESIPTGVMSIGSDGSIQHVNQALSKIFPARRRRPRHPPRRPLLARGHHRDQVPDEARAPHRRGLPPVGTAHR